MMKVSRKELAGMVKKALTEATGVNYSDLLPGAGPELDKYADKVDKFLKETAAKANELAEEADEIMKADILSHPRVGERNRVLLVRAGVMRRLRQNLVNMLEHLHVEA